MSTFARFASLIALTTAAACGDDPVNSPMPDAGSGSGSADASCPGTLTGTTCRITNDSIAESVTFAAKYTYVIPRLKQLFVQPNVTLTVEPGTTVKGEQGSVLVITRGAKIIADGTKDKNITFTSSQDDGKRTAGWWGGILILGKAPVNAGKQVDDTKSKTEAVFEAFTTSIPEGFFGGTDPHDSSGTLRYVHIEFAGFNFINDREFNNLTLCGVGDGTTLDFVQVHGGSDDGIEFFGGTVNVKHLVSSQNQDDGFDTDNGWQGKAQFVIVQNVSHPAGLAEASNGYESDNFPDITGNPTGGYKFTPRTEPTVSNVTLIGDHDYATANRNFAAVFRRGTGGHYLNHIWVGFQLGPEIRDAATEEQAVAGKLEIKYSMFFNNDTSATQLPPAQSANDIVEATYFTATNPAGDPHNVFDTNPGLTDPFNKTAPNFKPAANAPALTAGIAPPSDGFFDVSATYAGAIGADDWTAGWTRYPQN